MNNALLVIGALLAMMLGALFAVPLFIDWDGYRGVFEEEASRVLGRDVRVGGSANLRILPAPYVQFEKIRIADGPGSTGEPLFRAEKFTMWLSVAPLLRGVLEARQVELKRPVLRLAADRDGRGNWSTLEVKPAALPFVPNDVALQSVRISGGALSVELFPGAPPVRLDAIEGELAADALEGPYKFNGTFKWQGSAREVRLATARPDNDGTVRFKTSVRSPDSGDSYVVDGRLSSLTANIRLEADLSAKIAVDSARLRGAEPPHGERTGESESPGDVGRLAAFTKPSVLERPSLELKAKLDGQTAALSIKDIALSFENIGQPQLVTGEAKILWRDRLGLEVGLASRWLDLDRLAGAEEGAAPLEAARALVEALVEALPAEASTVARFSVDQVNLGGEAVSGLELAVASAEGPLELKELRARLPGGARVELKGLLAADEGGQPGFQGTVRLRGSSLNRFLAWATHTRSLSEGRSDGAFLIEGRLGLGARMIELTGATAELAGTPLNGDLRFSSAGRRRLSVSLEGHEINLGQLWPGLQQGILVGVWQPHGDEASLPGSGGAASGRAPDLLDPAASDLSLRLRAGQLDAGSETLRDVDVDLAVEQGHLTVRVLKLASAEGLALELEGDVEGLGDGPRGVLRGLAAAPSSTAIAALGRFVGLSEVSALIEQRAAVLVPMRVAFTLSLGTNAPGSVELTLDGLAHGGRLASTVRLEGGLQAWHQAPVDASVRFETGDVARVLVALSGGDDARSVRSESEPRAGEIFLKSAGTPANGLVTIASLKSDGLSLGYEGRVSFSGDAFQREIEGKIYVASRDARAALALSGLRLAPAAAGIAVDGSVDISGTGEALSLKTKWLTIGGAHVAGHASLTKGASQSLSLKADLTVDAATLPGLLRVVLHREAAGPPQSQSPGQSVSVWPEQPFDFSGLESLTGDVRVAFDQLTLAGGLVMEGTQLVAQLKPDRIRVEKLAGGALGGRLEAMLELAKAPAGVEVSGDLRITGAKLEALATPAGGSRRATGNASVSLSYAGRALSPSALIPVLKGKGEIDLGPAQLSGLAPSAVGAAFDAVLAGRSESGGDGLVAALRRSLAAGELNIGPRKIPVEITDGAARLAAFAVGTAEGQTSSKTTVDLASLKVDSEWRIEPKAGASVDKRAARGALPGVSVIYVGPLNDLAGIEPQISAGALERELTVRKLERNVDELERLRKLDEERARQEAERQRVLEEERQRLERERAARAAAALEAGAPPGGAQPDATGGGAFVSREALPPPAGVPAAPVAQQPAPRPDDASQQQSSSGGTGVTSATPTRRPPPARKPPPFDPWSQLDVYKN